MTEEKKIEMTEEEFKAAFNKVRKHFYMCDSPDQFYNHLRLQLFHPELVK